MSLHPPREGSRDTARGIIVSNFPDYCRSPNAIIPYTIVARQDRMAANTATTVKMTGQRAHKQCSIITSCAGDEPGTGLGIKSNTILSVCHRKEHSGTVRIEGEWATRHGDEWWMNNRNTTGKLVWPEHNLSYEPTPPIRYAFLDTSKTGPVTDASPAPELAPPTQLPSGPTSNHPPTPPPKAPVQLTPPSGSQWWSKVTIPKLGGGPSGHSAMSGMAMVDWWLKQNVNRPDEWFQKGLVRKQTPSPPNTGLNLLDQLGGVPAPTTKTDSPPEPHDRTKDNVSIKGRKRRKEDCELRPYKKGCPEAPWTTPHHVVADRAFRTPQGALYEGGVPHADGLSICVNGGTPVFRGPDANEHGLIHNLYNAEEKSLGLVGNPKGTARLGDLEDAGVRAAAAVTGCDPVKMKNDLRAYHTNDWKLSESDLFRADPSGKIDVDPVKVGKGTGQSGSRGGL